MLDTSQAQGEPESEDSASVSADFPSMLRGFRERRGLSQNALAGLAGRDPGTINRLESGKRSPVNRELLADIARALGLSRSEEQTLLGAAGHITPNLSKLGLADPDIQLVADILSDESIPTDDRREFRLGLRLAARRWRRVDLAVP